MPRAASLTREEVLTAGLAVLADDGLAAVTMRAVAQRLGVEAMSLYTYVHSKADLLHGMAGQVLAEIDHELAGETWQDVLTSFAHQFYGALMAYPELIPHIQDVVPTQRLLDGIEVVFAGLDGSGLRLADQVSAWRGLLGLCMGHALVNSRPGIIRTWEHWPMLEITTERLPHLLVAAPAFDERTPEDDFAYMVDNFVRGIAAQAPGGQPRRR